MRTNKNRHQGPIILLNQDTGDCEKFNSISSVMEKLKISDNNYRCLNKLKEHPAFKKKYIFFAMERDILSW